MFKLIEESSAGVISIAVPDMVDGIDFDRMVAALLEAIQKSARQKWVIDLEQNQYVGSAILGLLVNLREHIKRSGGTLILAALSPELLETFHTCCLERLFVITRNRNEALARMGG